MDSLICRFLLIGLITLVLSSCIYPSVNISIIPRDIGLITGDEVTIRLSSRPTGCNNSSLPCIDISGQFIDYAADNLPLGVSVSFDYSLRSVDTQGLALMTLTAAPNTTAGRYVVLIHAVLNGNLLGSDRFTLHIRDTAGSRTTPAVTTISATDLSSFAILADGTVRAWGDNSDAQLGDGTRITPTEPAAIAGLSNVQQLQGSCYHSLALLNNGSVQVWGTNEFERILLGVGLGISASTTPIPLPSLSDVQMLSARCVHNLALLQNGSVAGWGDNRFGQIGNGDKINQRLPVALPGLVNVQAVAAGSFHSLALLNNGTVTAWGKNRSGELGLGAASPDPEIVPVIIPGLSDVTAIAAGRAYSLALLSDGTVRAWGTNEQGQLGDGTLTDRPQPVVVQGLSNVIAIAAGDYHVLALLNDASVVAWGDNRQQQLGVNGSIDQRPLAAAVPGLNNVIAISAGGGHSLALLDCGTVRGWGDNRFGQLANSSFLNASAPAPVPVLNLGDASQCAEVALTVANIGAGDGTVSSPDVSLDCDGDCNSSLAIVNRDNTITLTATAAQDSQFLGWGDDCQGISATLDVVMDADKQCLALFEPLLEQAFLLSVVPTGAGSGTITSIPAGVYGPDQIDCGDICNAAFPAGATITVTATPDSGSQFGGWAGDCSGSNPLTQVTMLGTRQCIATFTASDFILTVNINGNGRVVAVQPTFSEIDCGDFCTDFYTPGTEVILVPAAESAANFTGWSGCDQVVDDGCVINMTSDRTVTATFN